MNILLDTHAVIWFITGDPELPKNAKNLIETSPEKCWVSVASLWEMGIKYSIGKLKLKTDLPTIFSLIDKSGIEHLPISSNHILTSSSLPWHHRDPFDRIIIAQAQCENLTVMSKDKAFKKYAVGLKWGT